jgi:FkbM family methyltransferase
MTRLADRDDADGAQARARLRADLRETIGNDRRLNAVALRHVLDAVAEPGLLAHRAFEDHELFFDPRDDKIGFTLLQGRQWQRRYIDRAVAHLRDAGRLRTGGTYVDVGANIGCTVLYAMASGVFSRAVAFEPEPHNRAILERNVALNGLADRVTIVPAAVGAEEGEGTLHLDSKNFGKHALADARPATGAATMAVPVTTLDRAFERLGVSPSDVSLLKVDTEGSETQVLAGARGITARGTPLVAEVTSVSEPAIGGGWEALLSVIGPGYSVTLDLDADSDAEAEALSEFAATAAQHELLIY